MAAELEQRVATLGNTAGVTFTPVDPARPSGAKMKGFPLLHLLNLMDERGPRHAEEWRATLPEALRAQTERRSVTSVAWIPVEFYFHGVDWLARRDYGGVRGAMQVGHHTATQDIGSFFRFIMAMTSPSTVLGLSGRFWKSYFDQSSLNLLDSTPVSCAAEIRNWPLPDMTSLYEMAGSLIAWAEASRARDVRVTTLDVVRPGVMLLEMKWS